MESIFNRPRQTMCCSSLILPRRKRVKCSQLQEVHFGASQCPLTDAGFHIRNLAGQPATLCLLKISRGDRENLASRRGKEENLQLTVRNWRPEHEDPNACLVRPRP